MNSKKYLKEYRLLTKNDFQSLRIDSRFFYSNFFIYFAKENNLENSRLGIAVPKKLGNAVKRNKIKRIIREHFRKSNILIDGFDILVTINFKNMSKRKFDYQDIIKSYDDDLKLGFKKISNTK